MSGLNTKLSKRYKDNGYKPVYSLTDDDAPINCREFVSTGAITLDLAIANRKDGGFPVGRITEVAGLESTGKSLLCANAIRNTQRKGGITVYFDTETAIFREYLEAIGVNLDDMLYVNIREIENILQGIEDIIAEVRSKDKHIPLTIVVDSYAGAGTKGKGNDSYERTGYNTDKAIIMSDNLGKVADLVGQENVTLILTNQLRQKMDAMAFSDPYTTPGGKALPFFSSVRLRMYSATKLKAKINGMDMVVGVKTKVKVVKNRVGPPFREAEFDIYFESGIDDFGGVFALAKAYKIVKAAGSWTKIVDKESGEVHQFQGSSGFRELMVNNPSLYAQVRDEIADNYIMKYNSTTEIDTDTVEEGEEVDDEI